MTFIAALRHDRIEAPWMLDGPVNGGAFKTYVEKVLVPTLKPGDLVIMDNLSSHKGKDVRLAIRSARAKLILLPKYSPDRSSRSSPSSSTCCERPQREPSKPSSPQSGSCWAHTPHKNAQTIS
jgi:hypothetical protein